ncbi:MAG: outer membrane lipoprotein carrier protein LolA, partial [Pseudomonadota bacterium]
ISPLSFGMKGAMNRRELIRIGAATAAMSAFPLPALAQVSQADLTRISNYLNGIGTMQGNFVQVGPDGDLSEGLFYMRRPGRIRFEYQPPNPSLIVADGFWVGVYDTVDNTLDRFPLSETPLDLLLRDRVNLRNEGAIQSIERSQGQLRVRAIDPEAPDQGSITMIFSDNPLQLTQWIVEDAQGLNTTVALSEIRRNVTLDGKLFFIEDPV